MQRMVMIGTLMMALMLGACGGDEPAPEAVDGTEAGARQVLNGLLQATSNEEGVERTLALRATSEDYAALFEEPLATDLEEMHAGMWAQKRAVAPKEGQTELLLWSATSEDLQNETGDAKEFPNGYKRAAKLLKPGITWYRFKFVKPGERIGMAFDGLAFVNGRWVFTPKPWRAVKED